MRMNAKLIHIGYLLHHCLAVTLCLSVFLFLFAGQPGFSQIPFTVQEGELYGLGVIPAYGESYEWHVFTDYTLSTEADTSVVVFPSGNMGASVAVIWLVSGTYYFSVLVNNAMGCSNLKIGMITVNSYTIQGPAIAIQLDKNPICPGSHVKFRAIAENQGGNAKYTWLKNGMAVGMNSPGYLDSTLVDGDRISCKLTAYVQKNTGDQLTVHSNEITVTVYTTIADFAIRENTGGSTGTIHLLNNSTGADEYDWDLGNGMSSFAENPDVTYSEEGIYVIRLVAHKTGFCSDTTELKYRMRFKGLYIPNAFAPVASGGLPGVFKPAGIGLKSFRIEVYDNWGHLLWQSAALDESGIPSEAWDGTYDGRIMPQDTYMWKAEAEFYDGTVWTGSDIGKGRGKTMGTVTLIR